VQTMTIKAATIASGHALRNALARFEPSLDVQDGECFVSIELGGDRHVIEVLAAIEDYVTTRPAGGTVSSMSVALDGRGYTVHRRPTESSP
jgi:hypothetical protein